MPRGRPKGSKNRAGYARGLTLEGLKCPLSIDELGMLRDHPYEQPRRVVGTHDVKIAQGLQRRKLLEMDPLGMVWRCTEKGTEASRDLTVGAARRLCDVIRKEIDDGRYNEADVLLCMLYERIFVELGLDGGALLPGRLEIITMVLSIAASLRHHVQTTYGAASSECTWAPMTLVSNKGTD